MSINHKLYISYNEQQAKGATISRPAWPTRVSPMPCIYLGVLATPAPGGTSPRGGGFATCPSLHLRFPSPLRYCAGVRREVGDPYYFRARTLKVQRRYVVGVYSQAMLALLNAELTAVIYHYLIILCNTW